jgi:argininosuccinate lyase
MTIARTEATKGKGGGGLDPAFLAWQTSLPIDVRLLEVDVRGSIAHVASLVDAKLVTPEEGETLSNALRSLPGKVESGKVQLDQNEEDVHMAVEAWLHAEVGDVAKKLHTGRSRNDQVATDLKLWGRSAVAQIDAALNLVVERVDAWTDHYGEVAMPAYTHRQVAIPTLARIWIEAALTHPLARDQALLGAAADEMSISPLGAGAIGGNTLPIDASVSAHALDFAGPPENPIDAVGERDHALTLAFVCARIGLHLNRFCADMVELTSDGMVKLSSDIACGSSMMPHKKNPDLFELVRAQAALRHGELMGLLATFQGLGSGYHRDLQQDKTLLFSSVDGTLACLKMIAIALQSFELVPDVCLRALREGDAIATDLTEHLVAEGTPFREAYQKVGSLVASQRERGKRLVDLTAADLETAGLPASLLERLDPAASAVRRAKKFTPGG